MSSQTSSSISMMQAIAMSVNIMVGAGVLTGPAIMAAIAGSTSFFGWILAALVMLPIVYNIARLPEAMPGAGGMYLYCKNGLGLTGGFIAGWLYFLGYNFTVAVLLCAFRNTFLSVYPDLIVLQNKYVFLAIGSAIIFTFNMLSARTSAMIQSSLTYFKLIPIFTAIALLPFFWKTSSFSINWAELKNVPAALPMAIFGYCGFEFCCSISNMVRGGAKAARSAMLIGFAFVMALYALFHYSVLVIMGQEGLIQFQASGLSSFVGVKFPVIANFLAFLLPITTAVTFFNSSNGLLFLDSILLQSLADDGNMRFADFFRILNSGGRPWIAVLVATLFSVFVGTVIPSLSQLAGITNVLINSVLALAIFALLRVEMHKGFGMQRIVTLVGLVTVLGLIGFSWTQLAPDNYSRFMSLVPALVGLVFGLLLFSPRKELVVVNGAK